MLSQIRGNQNIDEEYDSIKNSLDEEESGGGNSGGNETQQRIFVVPLEGNSARKYNTICTKIKTMGGSKMTHQCWSLSGTCD